VRFACERVKSGAANATPKLTSIIAGMAAGADCIDELDVIRSGGMRTLFRGVYAAITLGILLREFTHTHTRQLSAVLRRHLVALAARTPVLAGIDERVFIDIDSLLRPVYGHAKQGASFSHTKIAGKTVLRKGPSPLAVTITTPKAAPLLAGVRLRAGRAGSAKGAASMLKEAITTAVAAGADPVTMLVRGDSAYCSGTVVAAVVKTGALFSFAIARNPAVDAAISSIGDEQYLPVRYPGAVTDPDTGQLISDTQVAETPYTAFAGTRHEITGRLVVRRVLDANTQDPLFPVWRYHPFFTNNPEPVTDADPAHRHHAICETVWSDLIDGPWAHQPCGSFPANAAWTILAAICHNLLRAAGTLTGTARYSLARGATLRPATDHHPSRSCQPGRATRQCEKTNGGASTAPAAATTAPWCWPGHHPYSGSRPRSSNGWRPTRQPRPVPAPAC
jgi:hypothetical protein